MSVERTFIAIKPDGTQRGLVGEIISRFEKRGLKLIALKMVQPSKEFAGEHYIDLKSKPFYGALVDYFASGPVVAMVWEGLSAVKVGRILLGETNPQASLPGTIRGDFALDVGRNVCHGSDSVESANKEVAHWFKKEELVDWKNTIGCWVLEKGW